MKRGVKTFKKYFIPHAENDHKPKLLQARTVIFVCMVALVVEGVFLFGSSYIAPRSKLFGIIVVNTLIDGTNEARVAAGLSSLRENPLLDVAAQDKANDMVANNYFAHTSPAGLSPWYWFGKAGYDFSAAGENLAVNFSDSSDVTNAWLASPEHRANILNAGFTDIGMASAQGEYDGQPAIYVVELFGTPAPTFALAPAAQAATPPPSTSTPVVNSKPSVQAPAATPTTTPTATAPLVVTSSPTFIEVQGAGTVMPQATNTAPAEVTLPAAVAQANIVQQAAADPRRVVDYFFFALGILFAVALLLNIFIKIRIQYPPLILGGMLVIVLAGLFIILNHHLALGGIAIL
jgi:hypothetical protein